MKANKIILMTAGLSVFFGGIIAGTALLLYANVPDRDRRMETQTITENVSKINIAVDMSDIKIIPDDTEKITLTYFTDAANKYDITAEDGILSIEYTRASADNIKWYDYFFSIDLTRDHDIILKVPKTLSADISLKTGFGDIEVSGLKGNNMTVNTGNGDIELSVCDFTSIEAVTSYGDVDIERCESETLLCESDYGDIDIEKASGNDITLATNCGDIEGTIIGSESDYTIIAETDLGDKNIHDRSGGKNRLEAKTNLGDISIKFIN